MNKKYIVRLSDEERGLLGAVIKKLKGTGQKVLRAQVLLKADVDGPNWTDSRIAEAFGCRDKRSKGFVSDSSRSVFTRHWKGKSDPSTGREVAQWRAGGENYRHTTRTAAQGVCQLDATAVAHKVVELEIVESVSHETVRRTLKKTA